MTEQSHCDPIEMFIEIFFFSQVKLALYFVFVSVLPNNTNQIKSRGKYLLCFVKHLNLLGENSLTSYLGTETKRIKKVNIFLSKKLYCF